MNYIKDVITKPIDKFKRAVNEKIIKKSKVIFGFQENEKKNGVQFNIQSEKEKDLKKTFLINQFNRLLKDDN